MPRRLVILAVLAAILAALILLLPGGGRDAARGTVGDGAGEPAAADGLDPEPGRLFDTGGIVRAERDADDASAGTGGSPDAAVARLRVALRILGEDGAERVPQNCKGWIVRAQTWDSRTRSIVRHEAPADARGIAEFDFPGRTHVDWAATRPLAERWGESCVEPHETLAAGSSTIWTIHLAPAGAATGRVLDLAGTPAAGAVVHAFRTGFSYGLGNWTPGYVQAIVAADGTYRFDGLGAGDWDFAVEPGRWLQMEPEMASGTEGLDRAVIAGGETEQLGDLRVVEGAVLTVEVRDAAGAPVAGATVSAEALSLTESGLEIDEPEQRGFLAGDGFVLRNLVIGSDWLATPPTLDLSRSLTRTYALESAVILDLNGWVGSPALVEPLVLEALTAPVPAAMLEGFAGLVAAPAPVEEAEPAEPSVPVWRHPTVERRTDAEGRARFGLPAGRWRFTARTDVLGDLPAPAAEWMVPGPALVLRLPIALRGFAGRLVSEHGEPIASVALSLTHPEGQAAVEARSDAHGVFRFESVPASGTWLLRAEARDRVSCEWRVDLGLAAEADYYLPARAPLRVRLQDAQGDPLELNDAWFTLRALRTAVPPAPAGARAGDLVNCGRDQDETIGNFVYASLPEGEFDVALSATVWNGLWDETGPLTEARELGRWVLSTRDELWVLTIDRPLLQPRSVDWATLRGRVLDAATGEPLPGARVGAWLDQTDLGSTECDQDGNYELMFRPGAAAVYAMADERITQILGARSYGPGSHPTDFRVGAGSTSLRVRLLDREDQPVPDCQVRVLPGGGDLFWYATDTNDSWVELEDLPEGPLALECVTEGVVAGRALLLVTPGAPQELEVRLDLTLAEMRAAVERAAGGR